MLPKRSPWSCMVFLYTVSPDKSNNCQTQLTSNQSESHLHRHVFTKCVLSFDQVSIFYLVENANDSPSPTKKVSVKYTEIDVFCCC